MTDYVGAISNKWENRRRFIHL